MALLLLEQAEGQRHSRAIVCPSPHGDLPSSGPANYGQMTPKASARELNSLPGKLQPTSDDTTGLSNCGL